MSIDTKITGELPSHIKVFETEKIASFFDHIDRNDSTVAFIDIDENAIVANSITLFSLYGESIVRNDLREYNDNHLEKIIRYKNKYYTKDPVSTEGNLAETLDNVRRSVRYLFFLTSRQPKHHDITYQQLARLNLNPPPHSPLSGTHFITRCDHTYSIKDNIISAGYNSKGRVALHVLSRFGIPYKNIGFMDNDLSHILTMIDAFKEAPETSVTLAQNTRIEHHLNRVRDYQTETKLQCYLFTHLKRTLHDVPTRLFLDRVLSASMFPQLLTILSHSKNRTDLVKMMTQFDLWQDTIKIKPLEDSSEDSPGPEYFG